MFTNLNYMKNILSLKYVDLFCLVFNKIVIDAATPSTSRGNSISHISSKAITEKEKMFPKYGRGGHLGHLTLTIYINFCSQFQRRLHIKFGV